MGDGGGDESRRSSNYTRGRSMHQHSSQHRRRPKRYWIGQTTVAILMVVTTIVFCANLPSAGESWRRLCVCVVTMCVLAIIHMTIDIACSLRAQPKPIVERQIQFIPSRVEGITGATSVTVFADRIEITSGARIITHRFVKIARWPDPALFWRLMYRIGIKRRSVLVADRDWFQEPADMYFVFYTKPRLKICMPLDESKESYGASYFVRIQNLICEGGFETNDLG